MNHIQLLFYTISIFIAIATLSITVFINIIHKNKTLTFYIGMMSSFFFIQLAIVINHVQSYFKYKDMFLNLLAKISDILGTSGSCLFGLFLSHYLFGKKIKLIKMRIFFIIFLIQIIGLVVCQFILASAILKFVMRLSVACVIIYELMVVKTEYKNSKNYELQKVIKIFIILTVAFLPFFIFEAIRPQILLIKNMEIVKVLLSPSYFLSLNIYSLLISVTYFNTPVHTENNRLTDYFIKKYGITKKETEIIELMMTGMTYKQISERLIVSNKTVDNHVQNIYKKLDISNKVQLLNLIRSKEKH